MFLWNLFVTHTVILITVFVAAPSNAIPINALQQRAGRSCGDGGPPPCICNNVASIRDRDVRRNCPQYSFVFARPQDPTDGTLTLVNGNFGGVQCDQWAISQGIDNIIVELQFIANQINSTPRICAAFSRNRRAYESFYQFINGGSNVIFVDGSANNAKGVLISGHQFQATPRKAVAGAVDYLLHLQRNQGYPTIAVANAIANTLAQLVGPQNGFSSTFAQQYFQLISSAIASGSSQLPNLPIKSTSPNGGTFVNFNPGNFQRRRSQPIANSTSVAALFSSDPFSPFVNGTRQLPTPAPLGASPTGTISIPPTNTVPVPTGASSNATITASSGKTMTTGVASSTLAGSVKASGTLASGASTLKGSAASTVSSPRGSATTSPKASTIPPKPATPPPKPVTPPKAGKAAPKSNATR